MHRQGDILIIPIAALPERLELVAQAPVSRPATSDTPSTRVVLAYSDVTGHAHAFHRNASLFRTEESVDRYLRVGVGGATLQHEEHGTIAIPAGNYVVRRQREYRPDSLPMQVAD